MKNVLFFRKNIKMILLTLLMLVFSVLFCSRINAASAVYEFTYKGDYQTFVVPRSGIYKLETWGAQGGYRSNANMGGKGGYAQGLVYLNRGDVLYVYVGGSGKTHNGWNGGGQQTKLKHYGGGATDWRIAFATIYIMILITDVQLLSL